MDVACLSAAGQLLRHSAASNLRQGDRGRGPSGRLRSRGSVALVDGVQGQRRVRPCPVIHRAEGALVHLATSEIGNQVTRAPSWQNIKDSLWLNVTRQLSGPFFFASYTNFCNKKITLQSAWLLLLSQQNKAGQTRRKTHVVNPSEFEFRGCCCEFVLEPLTWVHRQRCLKHGSCSFSELPTTTSKHTRTCTASTALN